jgi:PAT family beta-lactamase induction signal transducer AmpG
VFFFGLTSGILLMMTGNSLNFWLTTEGASLAMIGLFTITSLPYVIKFFLASIIDKISQRYHSNTYLSCRRVILIINACFVLFFCCLMFNLNIVDNILSFSILCFFFSLVAVSTDVILDGYRVDLAERNKDHGMISAMFVFGYRVGMFLAGAGGIYLSIYFKWPTIYLLFSFVLFLLIISFAIFHRVKEIEHQTKFTIREILFYPWQKFRGNKNALIILVLFIFFYKLGDQIMLPMLNPFLFKYIGYNEYEMSLVVKTFGFVSSILGSFIGGYLIKKSSMEKCLPYFAIIHSFSYLFYIYQYHIGYNLALLEFITIYATITSGMCMTGYIAFIASMCGGSYSSTQYAFFSSMIGASRVILPSFSGNVVESIGWNNFFMLVFVISLPGVILSLYIPKLSKTINRNKTIG